MIVLHFFWADNAGDATATKNFLLANNRHGPLRCAIVFVQNAETSKNPVADLRIFIFFEHYFSSPFPTRRFGFIVRQMQVLAIYYSDVFNSR